MKMMENATIYMIVFIMLFNFCMIQSIFLDFLIFCQKVTTFPVLSLPKIRRNFLCFVNKFMNFAPLISSH